MDARSPLPSTLSAMALRAFARSLGVVSAQDTTGTQKTVPTDSLYDNRTAQLLGTKTSNVFGFSSEDDGYQVLSSGADYR